MYAIHDAQIAEHGGADGLRDPGTLAGALDRPRNKHSYGNPPPDLADLAAAYAFGIAKAHAFVDGNKRTATVVMETFIELNGSILTATDAEIVTTIGALAAGESEESSFAAWLRTKIEKA